ncbi:MAG: hypothetical protein HOC20_12840 [Chloroflexi bacterium]|nr:hypothetical protein [Chloroflexota bacterium]
MDERPFTAESFAHSLRERKLVASGCTKCGSQWCPPIGPSVINAIPSKWSGWKRGK